MKQTTLANKISCQGIGLHSGKPVTMTMYPAAADTGIMFKRLDIASGRALIPAWFGAVCDTRLGTTIGNYQGVTVATVEHLMAALWGMGIDNAVVELDGPEVPIMDGSSEPFIAMIESAGIVPLASPRRTLRVIKPIEVRDGDSVARVESNRLGDEGCTISIEIDFNHPVIDKQTSYYDFQDTSFKQSLSRARTFGFEHEVEALRKKGLALGGSLTNAVVVGKDRVLNKEGLRYDDEFIRHKALDCLGDLYLAGCRIDGHFTFVKPGHAINHKLLKALFADDAAYVMTKTYKPSQPVFSITQPAIPAYA